MADASDAFSAFLKKNPDIRDLDAFIIDVNGIPRGKRLPLATAAKLFKSGLRLPRSAYAVDVWGQDVIEAGLVMETGDNDGICRPVVSSLARVPWAPHPTAQILLSMEESDGTPFFGDPRRILQNVLGYYARKGLTPVVAAELEFYLTDPATAADGRPQPPLSQRNGLRATSTHLYNMDEMADFAPVLDDIHTSCRLQGIPTDTTISENGPGQFEINLMHVPDALQAADLGTLMKRAVRGVARKHGLDATFMAKPYGDKSGSGMHVHFSILDSRGQNIFSGSSAKGSPALRHAVGGLLAAMPASTLVFAPNANSYRRFAAGSHAPTTVSWGYDNRTAALRIPESDRAGTRIEHRVAGADANLYLALAVMLAGAYDGITRKTEPMKAYTGNVWDSDAQRLPAHIDAAQDAFCNSAFIHKYLGPDYVRLYSACKRQERSLLDHAVNPAEHAAYLRDI